MPTQPTIVKKTVNITGGLPRKYPLRPNNVFTSDTGTVYTTGLYKGFKQNRTSPQTKSGIISYLKTKLQTKPTWKPGQVYNPETN